MVEVLTVYTEVNVQIEAAGPAGVAEVPADGTVTVSVDEKPGVQAIANTAPDLPPCRILGVITNTGAWAPARF
jgi:hypothetical protein